MGNIEIAWEDVFSVIDQIKGHLIVVGAALVIMIAALILARKLKKPKRGFVRKQSVLAFLLVLVVVLNMLSLGELKNTISAVMMENGELQQATIDYSRKVVEEISSEGIVLTRNEDGVLPLEKGNLNVFGWASTNPIYGGTGSGTVDASTAVSLLDGLENAGFQLNTELAELYTSYREDRPVVGIFEQEWTLPEVPVEQYSDELLSNAEEFSDTAVIVLARSGGEGADLPHDMGAVLDGSWQEPGTKYVQAEYKNNSEEYDDFTEGQTYLELSQTEKNMIDMVCQRFDDVVVVYNGANTLEMGWTEEYEQIKGVVICPGTGATGFNALGKVLTGEVNPSGKTADTWVRDLTATPYFNNIGHFAYNNVEDITEAAKAVWEKADGIVSFVDYTEGIYIGYRFYETAAEEGLINYEETVMYPFGYGLSYTTFSQEMGQVTETDGVIHVDVTVTNTGDTAGKEVVELYYNPPYTDGGIEKANTNLAAFDKTQLLEPGQSETITLSFDVEDMASYDTYGARAYVLEQGDYQISLRTDSHTVVSEQTYTVAETIIYDENNTHNDDLEAATNQLEFAEGDIEYLSRAGGFANYESATAAPDNFELQGELFANGSYNPEDYNNPEDEMPVTGANNGLELYDLRGADYDDPQWDKLLDQVTVDEMVDLIGYGGYQSIAVDSVNKLASADADGPAGVNARVTESYGTGYCSEIMIAQTWNTDLARAAGDGIAKELLDFRMNGWYGPSMNLHRSAFGGRDFEYYSEDSTLSAEMAKAEVQAAADLGVYAYMKHLAFNEQEINRNGMLCTWLNEQSARELYLKPFEVCVKEVDGPIAMMSSFNYIGTKWAAESTELLQQILRNEWGFRGMVISDYFGNYGYMDADRAVRGGTDMMLATAGNDAIMTDLSATSVQAMRQATKNIFYTVVNSHAYESYEPGTIPTWIMAIYIADGVLALIFIGLEILLIRNYMKRRKDVVMEVVEVKKEGKTS